MYNICEIAGWECSLIWFEYGGGDDDGGCIGGASHYTYLIFVPIYVNTNSEQKNADDILSNFYAQRYKLKRLKDSKSQSGRDATNEAIHF